MNSFNQQASDYLDVPSESIFLKRAKYLIAVPMAKYLKNVLPSAPDGTELVWKGSFLRWMKPRLSSYRAKNTHLWFSFLQGKRSAAPVSKDIVLENFQKHRQQMMAPDPLDPSVPGSSELIGMLLDVIEPLLNRLSRRLDEDLGSFFDDPVSFTHHASNNASFESSRKTGGQAGHIRTLIREMGGRTDVVLDSGQLEGMREIRGFHTFKGNVSSLSVQETRARHDELDELVERVRCEIRNGDSSVPRYDAMIEAVLEPLKVRTISKGPAVAYYLAKKLQQSLHSRLRKEAPFRLIGKPFDPTDLIDVRRAFESNWLRDTSDVNWLSVDYSAATDGLSARLSSEIMQRLLSRLAVRNLSLYRVMLGVLAPHRISYPPLKTKSGRVTLAPVDQVNGQLMGSVLSFPILCLANFALYMLVKRWYCPEANWHDLYNGCLINGDDLVYIGSTREWRIHHALGEKIGLKMSPGKAYIHKRYANINSVSVDYDLSRPEIPGRSRTLPMKIGYLNTGLFFGKHKVQSTLSRDGDGEQKHPLSASMNELLSGSLPSKSIELLSSYLHRHRKELAEETRGRNLFLPISVGGMGVVAPSGWKSFVTPTQRHWAGGILMKNPLLVSNQRPRPSGLDLVEYDDKLVDPVSSVIELEEFRRHPKGSQKHLKEVLRFGVVPYLYSKWELFSDDDSGSDYSDDSGIVL